MKKNFKVNDWCFSNFELCQIKNITDGRVTSVTDGMAERGGYDLTYSCFPLEMDIKRISDYVHYYYKKLHDLNKLNLNYPDIVRWLEMKWADICNNKSNDEYIKKGYDEVRKFYESIEKEVYNIKDIEVNGVSLIRKF